MFALRGPLFYTVSGTFARETLERVFTSVQRVASLCERDGGNRLKTISTNILWASRGSVLRKFTPAMHRISLVVLLNSRYSYYFGKQWLARTETTNFYSENKLLPFAQVLWAKIVWLSFRNCHVSPCYTAFLPAVTGTAGNH